MRFGLIPKYPTAHRIRNRAPNVVAAQMRNAGIAHTRLLASWLLQAAGTHRLMLNLCDDFRRVGYLCAPR
jgi:hypothetical protein